MTDDPEHLTNWQRLDARTTTSGRLKPEDVATLADLGVRHVINLALAESPGALADEPALMAQRGLRYTHIPVPFDAPEETHYQAFRAAYDADGEPVLRVGAGADGKGQRLCRHGDMHPGQQLMRDLHRRTDADGIAELPDLGRDGVEDGLRLREGVRRAGGHDRHLPGRRLRGAA